MIHKAKVYRTNHPISKEMSAILAKGFDAQLVPPVTMLPGLVIAYGILRGTGDIIREAEQQGREFLYCDYAYFSAYRRDQVRRERCYYRLVRNDRYIDRAHQRDGGERFQRLQLEVRPWRLSGNHIVVVPPSAFLAAYLELDHSMWLNNVMKRLAKYTTRDIIIKPKDNVQPFEQVIKDAWAVVVHDSMAAVDAIRLGIPVFTNSVNAVSDMAAHDLSQIEDPVMPDRTLWLNNLANQQFTLEEIENGTARAFLFAD